MRILGTALQNHLDTHGTSLAWCWKVARKDGVILGFTNHDEDITFDSVTYEAETGLLASEIESSIGGSVDLHEIEGALDSAALTEADIAAGKYDDATVTIYLVNWQDVSQRVILKIGNIGEISRGQNAFRAEFRGLSARIQQNQGRAFLNTCSVKFGSTKCGIDATTATYRTSTTVASVTNRSRFTVATLAGYDDGYFTRGKIEFLSGSNSGEIIEIKYQSGDEVVLWQEAPFTVSPGDSVRLTAGCDKRLETCIGFGNVENFRGFPHIPNSDLIQSYVNQDDEVLDGSSFFN